MYCMNLRQPNYWSPRKHTSDDARRPEPNDCQWHDGENPNPKHWLRLRSLCTSENERPHEQKPTNQHTNQCCKDPLPLGTELLLNPQSEACKVHGRSSLIISTAEALSRMDCIQLGRLSSPNSSKRFIHERRAGQPTFYRSPN
jgi:hypothetical protein